MCKRLNSELLNELLDDPTYRIGDEDANRRSPSPAEDEADAPEDTDTITEDEIERIPIFGRSGAAKRPGPPTGTAVTSPPSRRPAASVQQPVDRSISRPDFTVAKRWWKALSASDAQHPPRPTSAVTGNLRLSKAGHPIDHKTYFRRDFFGMPSGSQPMRTILLTRCAT